MKSILGRIPSGRPARLALALVGSVSIVALAGPAFAAGAADAAEAPAATASSSAAVSEVVVTARRVEESLQKVPVAVTAIGATALREQAITNNIEVADHSPSMQLQTTYGRLTGNFAIRGIADGTTTYFAEVAGGPSSVPSAGIYDLASVQVLNGPQGTLFGRTNIAGAVLMEPVRPKFNEYSGFVDVSEGNLGLSRATAAVNIPLIDDQLAIRIAVNRNYLDGYTKELNSAERLNGTNNYGGRLSVNWRPGDGKFSNYTVFDYLGADETSPGWILAAYNPSIATFNLPTSINAPNGLSVGAARFGAVCQQAINAGVQTNLNGCINQRLQIAGSFLPALQAETARLTNGGHYATRSTPASVAGLPEHEYLNLYTLVNQSQYDFGDLGFTTLTVKNIFGFQAVNGNVGWQIDGIGGALFSAISGNRNFPLGYATSANQTAVVNGQAQAYFAKSPYQQTISDELQIRGVIGKDLISWSLGGYYQNQPSPENTQGITNIARTFGGITLPDLGFTPSFAFQSGGYVRSEALFGQATADLGRFVPFIAGLHLTGGLRHTWDRQEFDTLTALTNVATGQIVPGAPAPVASQKSDGWNTNLSLDAQITDDLLIYATTRKAYVPGGANTVIAGEGLPNYSPVYGPETVRDYELGAKADFHLGEVRGRIDADIYQNDFSNIFVKYFGAVNGVTATYMGNAAAARIRGFEFQGQLAWRNWNVSSVYSYADARYTNYIASDPLSLIGPGDPRCLPGNANVCLLNLTNSVFPNIPKQQGSVTVRYVAPLPGDAGDLTLSATGFYQTRFYFSPAASRNIEAFAALTTPGTVLNSQSQGAYGKLNVRAEWKNAFGSRVSVAAFANNVTDTNYAVSNLSVLQTIGTAVVLYGEPRTMGVELRYEFGG